MTRFGVAFILLSLGLPGLGATSRAEERADVLPIRLELRPLSYHLPIGQPVWVYFSILNEADEPLTLTVPNAKPRIPDPEISLPLSHIFSGGDSAGVSVRTGSGNEWHKPVGFRSKPEAPILLLGPRGAVGRAVDLRTFFPALRSAGHHRVTWQPYGAGGPTASTTIVVAARKRVEFVTDYGPLTLEMYYDDAPQTVENFLELVRQGFYEGLSFHQLTPGYVIQGGCREGNGTGVRADGKRIPSEPNGRPHDRGSVSMALLDDEPDTASTQFFICYTRVPEWDGQYTVFAHLVGDRSYETLDKLMAKPVDEQGRPLETLPMRAVRAYDAPAQPTE